MAARARYYMVVKYNQRNVDSILEMLRYDRSTVDRFDPGRGYIIVSRETPNTIARWQSFGFSVSAEYRSVYECERSLLT